MNERIVSADSHVAMRPEQVKARLEGRFHDAYDAAVEEHEQRTGAARAQSNLGEHWFRDGHWEGPAHLADMDADGLAAEVVYCEVSAFRYLYRMTEGAVAATRAFNDTLADYASADPDRLIVSYQIPLHDMDDAIAEVQRVVALGGRSLQVPVFPAELGLPDYHDDRYAPLWAAVQETGLPLCCHVGLNAAFDDLAARGAGPGLGCLVARQHRRPRDPSGLRGAGHFASPEHPPTTWPNSQSSLARQFAGIPDADRRKIVCDNAARVWNLA